MRARGREGRVRARRVAARGSGPSAAVPGIRRDYASRPPMRMTRPQWKQLVDHAVREAPNECCGYVRARDGAVDQVIEATNARSSPYGYELDGPALLEV